MSIPPQPRPDSDSLPFWDGLRQGKLLIQYSEMADRWQFPPLERCRHSGGPLVWRQVGRRGRIHSFIVQRQALAPGYGEKLPYVIALVELAEAPGIRLPTQLVGCVPEQVQVGDQVSCEIVPLPGGDFQIPVFRPVAVGDEGG